MLRPVILVIFKVFSTFQYKVALLFLFDALAAQPRSKGAPRCVFQRRFSQGVLRGNFTYSDQTVVLPLLFQKS